MRPGELRIWAWVRKSSDGVLSCPLLNDGVRGRTRRLPAGLRRSRGGAIIAVTAPTFKTPQRKSREQQAPYKAPDTIAAEIGIFATPFKEIDAAVGDDFSPPMVIQGLAGTAVAAS